MLRTFIHKDICERCSTNSACCTAFYLRFPLKTTLLSVSINAEKVTMTFVATVLLGSLTKALFAVAIASKFGISV